VILIITGSRPSPGRRLDTGLRRCDDYFIFYGSVMIKQPAVYIPASARNGTLYSGITSDLIKRVWEHKNNSVDGFTKQYNVHNLVWFELHENMNSAIEREKNIKEWKRAWKLNLIEKNNPEWRDLYNDII
jgi:putative endonuclease